MTSKATGMCLAMVLGCVMSVGAQQRPNAPPGVQNAANNPTDQIKATGCLSKDTSGKFVLSGASIEIAAVVCAERARREDCYRAGSASEQDGVCPAERRQSGPASQPQDRSDRESGPRVRKRRARLAGYCRPATAGRTGWAGSRGGPGGRHHAHVPSCVDRSIREDDRNQLLVRIQPHILPKSFFAEV